MFGFIAVTCTGKRKPAQPATGHPHQMTGILAALLTVVATPALAMNQEGHDGGWITDFPPGLSLLEAIPEARPLPSRRCPVTAEMLASNPYEQIQLPKHGCRPDLTFKIQPVTPLQGPEDL